MGVPTKFTKEIADEICTLLISGDSLRTICKREGMPAKNTVLSWLNKNEDFQTQYTCARAKQADAIFDEMLDIADESVNDYIDIGDGKKVVNQEAIQRARLRIDTRKWVLGKMKPKKYGDKVDIDVTGDIAVTVMEIVTREEADADDDGFIST
jgi:hypothetical protein